MNGDKYSGLFRKIVKEKHGIDIDFKKIEKRLKHLKEGAALTYADLENIADDSCWPFNKYWMWPSKDQIEEKLSTTEGWFKTLLEDSNYEEKCIADLDGIFKNIALVSIILRFVFPKRYAIYSRPTLRILRTERGENDVEEYLNYINDLRLLRQSFGVPNTSDMDMIVWAIAQEEQEPLREFKKLLAEQLPENLSPEELIFTLPERPSKIAEAYYRKKAYRTSGMWAATAFEKFLSDECKRLTLRIPQKKKGRIQTLINCLSSTDKYWYKQKTMKDLKGLRNKAVHESENFTKDDAYNFLTTLTFFRSKRK